jgi:hypothetical protein
MTIMGQGQVKGVGAPIRRESVDGGRSLRNGFRLNRWCSQSQSLIALPAYHLSPKISPPWKPWVFLPNSPVQLRP